MEPSAIASYVVGLRRSLATARAEREKVWNDCWRIYRGATDYTSKEKWQARISLPKAWNAVEQATSLIARYLAAAREPWFLTPYDPANLDAARQASIATSILRILLDRAHFLESFTEGLRIGFITGVGIWKVWWGLEPFSRIDARTTPVLTDSGVQLAREIVRTEGLDGRLFIRAIDPNNFYWLPGSRLNAWTGTIEDIEIPRWELEVSGLLTPEQLSRISTGRLDPARRASSERFGVTETTPPLPTVKITEYYGPLLDSSGRVVEPYAHVVLANDTELLIAEPNPFWDRRAPYVGFSPIPYPLRTDGVGIVELVRDVITNLNEVVNLSVDSILYTLLPVFEGFPEAYENPDELRKPLKPGTFLRRSHIVGTGPAISKIEFGQVSQAAVQVAAILDRAFQEGSLISEILQALPRYRGVQTATEIEAKAESQNSFFGYLATQIEEFAIKPLIELSLSRMLQFLATSADPAIAAQLGLPTLATVSREELVARLSGPFSVHVGGITESIKKSEQLQSLMQLMTVIGQNAQAWGPYVRQDAFLRSILESFRPALDNIDSLVASPEEVEAKLQQQRDAQLLQQLLPTLLQQQQPQQSPTTSNIPPSTDTTSTSSTT